MELLEDVKPRVGPIPAALPLPPTSWGKIFFKVELLVGEDRINAVRERMLPFHQHHDKGGTLSTDYYMATEGLAFSIRVKIARPACAGTTYGGRVYVDSGVAGDDVVFRQWSDDAVGGTKDEAVDRSKADHYFWFSPGSDEHIIQGFYISPTKSQRFVFAQPNNKRTNQGERVDMLDELNRVGVIRIVFCLVEEMEERCPSEIDRIKNQTIRPKQAKIDDRVEHKIRIAAQPGKVVNDGSSITRQSAILSKDIVYERRIKYNTHEGFSANYVTAKHCNNVDYYKGMPLRVLLNPTVRFQAIMTFFRAVCAKRIDLTQGQRLETAGTEDQSNTVDTNCAVRVEDIVHFVCDSLSPAASYIVCTGQLKEQECGKRKILNYGEKYVQKHGDTVEIKLQDFAAKENGLVTYFLIHPGVYELKRDGENPTMTRNRKNYKVKLAILDLVDPDSDDEE